MSLTAVDEEFLANWRRVQEATEHAERTEPSLKDGDGSGTSDGMTVPIKDYVDARDDAVESRLMAKLDTLATKDEIRAASASTRNNIWGAVGVALGIVLAVLGFAGDRFDAGYGMADQRQAQIQRDAQQDAAAKDTSRKFDELLRRIPAPPPAKP